MVLMQFNSQERADQFFQDHNGKYFNSIEQERCKIVFVRSIEFDPVVSEDQTDSDALEEKHADDEAVDTTPLSPRSERRASSAQMRKLFPPPPAGMTEIPTCAETLHTYSLELETQRVWDYAGDGYVHRLILNKGDGKFVEFPSPNNVSGERSQTPPTTAAEEEEGEHRKLEKLAVEYNFLLKSQLEEQRLYYERLLAQVEEGESRQLLNAHEHERKHLKKANAALAEKAKKLEEELTFVRELNKSLIQNQTQWKEQIRTLEEKNARVEQETALRISDLEGQVRDLMFYLDTQNKVEQSAHREDIMGGTIEIESKPTAKETSSTTSSSRRKGKSKKR
ncbi:hypothetical protein ON010_g18137 [Phytophthora cinnamomi]|nr:hypothetical protein ON010_g18137 [Phytophthora cinnamomi]